MKRLAIVVVATLLTATCGGSNPTAPSTAPPAPAPTPTTYTLSGTVTSTAGGAISGATVRISDGANAGKSALTNSNGSYALTGLAVSGFSVGASATNYNALGKSVTLTSSQVVDFQLTPTPLYTRSGSGDTVFDMPTTVSRITITGRCSCSSTNFIVKIGGRLVVNELLGTSWGTQTFSGTYVTVGGVTEITNSSAVSWTFTEAR